MKERTMLRMDIGLFMAKLTWIGFVFMTHVSWGLQEMLTVAYSGFLWDSIGVDRVQARSLYGRFSKMRP